MRAFNRLGRLVVACVFHAAVCQAQGGPTLSIVSPAPGTVVRRGEVVDVELRCSNPASIIDVLVDGDGLSQPQVAGAAAVVRLSIVIDAEALAGSFSLHAAASLAGAGVLEAPSVPLFVQGPTAIAISVDSSETFTFVGQQRTLSVYATDPSGSERLPPELLAFASSAPSVADVSSSGIVTAHSDGTTTVTVRYSQPAGDVTAVVAVTVKTGQPGDLNADGFVTADDAASLALMKGLAVRVPNDGRDLNRDGVIDQLDVSALRSTCVPSCQPPVGVGDSYTVVGGNTLSVPAPGPLANDTANSASGLTAYLSAQPTGGTLALQSDGAFTYTPSLGFSGTDSFRYRPSTISGGAGSEVAVTITVTPPPPTATNDVFNTAFNTPLTVSAPGILANDLANGGAGLSAVLTSAATAGTVTLSGNGGFGYSPPGGFTGVATFQYRAQTTNGGQSAPATVSIMVGSGQPPSGVDDAYAAASGTDLSVTVPGVLSNDGPNGGGTLTSQMVTAPLHGTLTLSSNGAFVYRSAAGYAGLDSYTYRPYSAFGAGNLTTVRITVSSTPVPPTPVGDAYEVAVNGTLTVAAPGVLGNDLANGGDQLLASLARTSQQGTVTLNQDGSFTYRPTAGFTGLDTFTYRPRTTAGGLGSEGTVTIRVQTTVPQPPTDVRVARVDGREVTFVWTAPATGPAPLAYQLEGGLAPGQTLGTLPAGSGEALRLTLPAGTFYVRLRTQTSAGLSAPSADVVVQVGLPNPPSAPAGLLGMVSGNRVVLAWTPTFQGGTPTGAVLDVSGALSGSVPLGSLDRFEFPMVPAGQYTFTVRQANAQGPSSGSNAVTLSFPSTCSGVPAAPLRLRTVQAGGRVTILWDPPATGAAPATYLLTVSGSVNATVPMSERTIMAPVPPGTYTLTVSGANDCGTGASSVAHTFTVQ